MASSRQLRVPIELTTQREYAEQLALQGDGFALVAVEAFVRGIRDIGYKSTATALDELIDNAIQAGADRVDVAFGYGTRSTAKPDRIAVIDNGHGMDPEMIRASVMWGGTHREGNRDGFGRYGYGLPSSCVSQGRRFAVYSSPEGGDLNEVVLDLGELGAGAYRTEDGRIAVPQAQEASLPEWVSLYRKEQGMSGDFTSGTAIVVDQLDRLTWVTTATLERHLLQHFGVTYRNYLGAVELWVNGKRVEPIDPLFLTEGFRHFDIDEDRAISLEPLILDVKTDGSRKSKGTIKVRYSWLPPTFASKDKTNNAARGNANARLGIMRDHLGIIVMRAGRQIDVLTRSEWTQFQNNDRYWNVEIDFSPDLDEEFSITTSKQQVVMSPRMWDILKENGVYRAIGEMRKSWREASRALQTKKDNSQQRASEQVMAQSEVYKTSQSSETLSQRQEEGDRQAEMESARRAREGQVSLDEAREQIQVEAKGHPYKVQEESIPGGPFYRPQQMGAQFTLWINTAHKFYMDVYAGPESTPRLRACLELLLFNLGEAELDSPPERQMFYQTERQGTWTTRLSTLLDLLDQVSGVEDDEAMGQEIAEVESSQVELISGVALS